MAGPRAFAAAILLSLLAAAVPATAQTPPTENIQIGLSTDTCLDHRRLFRRRPDHLRLAGKSPTRSSRARGATTSSSCWRARPRPVVVRRKDRVLGVWVNLESETFENVPVSYSVATTRPLQDVTDPNSYKQLSLGASNLYMQPADAGDSPATIEEFTAALRDRKAATGLYSENVGGVQFLSQNLFRATVRLAPNVPVGTHKARAFLFKSGLFIKESSAQLEIRKSGFEQSIFRVAHDYSFLYGVFAVSLAMLTGWLGRLVFRRD